MTTPPNKLPSVKGSGAIAQGFRMTWETVNRLIDYTVSSTLRSSSGAQVTRTPHGTTLTPNVKQAAETTEEGGDARWS